MRLNKENYELAKVNGLLERLRGDEISHRIGEIIPMSEQIAILMDKDSKPEKYAKYQILREEVKASVDEDMRALEGGIEA